MNRETESHFSNEPNIHIQRSKLRRPHTHKTTFSAGSIIPIYVDSDILPGDSVSMDMGSVIRMATPLYPVMDNAFMDIYFFFVPHRLVWEHWREFWGQNDNTAWEQQIKYEIPQIEAPSGGWAAGTIADYMGIPTYLSNISVNHLPFRAYALIMNDWFRDENLRDGTFFNRDETTLTGVNTGNYVTDIQLGGLPYKAAKLHDYFTSALPSPQKGPQVDIGAFTNPVPVMPGEWHIEDGMKWEDNVQFARRDPNNLQKLKMDETVNGKWYNLSTEGKGTGKPSELVVSNVASTATGITPYAVMPGNLWAGKTDVNISIESIRTALAIQSFYEAQARYGSRYTEFIRGVFGVTSPDARQQRPEYMGGFRVPINVTQVLQTSSTDNTSPQGHTAAFSYTPDQHSVFTASFTEHGTLMGLAVIRTDKTYQQGIERMWNRKKWTDFYIPQFANLGEQAILNKEIYAQGNSTDDEAFGYQEAWADYRYKPNRVSGAMRSNYPGGSLDSWHYADNYASLPILGEDWIEEDPANVARTLAVQNEPEFIADFYFDSVYVRPMPVYSIPGIGLHY